LSKRFLRSLCLGCVQATTGWSTKAVQAAAADMKYSPMMAGICAKSDAEFVELFIRRCNRKLFERLRQEAPSFAVMSPLDRAKTAIRWRLEMQSPYISAMQTCFCF
jgi:rpsU-divergently transcribed protein